MQPLPLAPLHWLPCLDTGLHGTWTLENAPPCWSVQVRPLVPVQAFGLRGLSGHHLPPIAYLVGWRLALMGGVSPPERAGSQRSQTEAQLIPLWEPPSLLP